MHKLLRTSHFEKCMSSRDAATVFVHHKAQRHAEDRTCDYARHQRPVIAPDKSERHHDGGWAKFADDHKHQISMERQFRAEIDDCNVLKSVEESSQGQPVHYRLEPP